MKIGASRLRDLVNTTNINDFYCKLILTEIFHLKISAPKKKQDDELKIGT